ncbi:hypothetical protein FF38_06284 [Lucilia cuprina]|uniref:Uncharacterized protein n=1 Tax=Lucilia cuprina TaxID=7375 RepID=A0A0L0CLH7_LUCCU|nr:hypothetical protein FF38_06284 [Lucilia cuprina]
MIKNGNGFLLWHTVAYFHIITMINMNAALLYINAKATISASNSLSARFEKWARSHSHIKKM